MSAMPHREPPPDPRRLVADLERAGMSKPQIARAIGTSRQTVWRFSEGLSREPGYLVVERLAKLAAKVVAKAP